MVLGLLAMLLGVRPYDVHRWAGNKRLSGNNRGNTLIMFYGDKAMTAKRKTESVWDYPRPAVLQRFYGRLRVEHGGVVLADSERGYRVLETSHPPTYYLPRGDVDVSRLRGNGRRTFCEWKGTAHYFDLVTDGCEIHSAAWAYPDPAPSFESIKNHVSFYASKVDTCFVDGEQVLAQEGDYYGGWITSNIEGPFKGGSGTRNW